MDQDTAYLTQGYPLTATSGISSTLPGIFHVRKALDGGNRTIKFIGNDGNPRALKSCIAELSDWEDAKYGEDTVLIEYGTKRYLVGQGAKDSGGLETFTATETKAERTEIMLFASVEPEGDNCDILIDTLALALPDRRRQEDVRKLEKIASGTTKHYVRNGQPVNLKVNKLDPVDEALAAWRHLWNKGGFKYKCNNAVLDLGGGTALGRIITPKGQILRKLDIQLQGTKDLALRIAAALQKDSRVQPDLGLIMDAIADKSFKYGVHGVGFEGVFQNAKNAWVEDISARLRSQWQDQLDTLGEIFIVGGSAPLAQALVDRSKGRINIASNRDPQFMNLYGLMEVMSD